MTTPEDMVATPGVQNSATSRRPLVADLLERVQAILLRPGSAWTDIAAENHSIAHIYKSYLIFLAAIPAIAGFIGFSLVGVGAFGISVRVPLVQGLVSAVVSYVLSLVMAMVVAWVLGLLLIAMQYQYIFSQGWLHIKLLFVVLLTVYQMYAEKVRKQLLAGTCKLTGKQARLINEVPAVIMLVVVLMVELQPFK